MVIIQPIFRGNDPERIICAAIYYMDGKKYAHQPVNIESGYVIGGLRHPFIIAIHHELTGNVTNMYNSIQGFLTSKYNFVNRIEAATIAVREKQAFDIEDGDELISEDLY